MCRIQWLVLPDLRRAGRISGPHRPNHRLTAGSQVHRVTLAGAESLLR